MPMLTQTTVASQPIKPGQTNYYKLLLFTIMGIMTLVVFVLEVVFFSESSAGRTRHFSMKWLLIPHILFASTGFLVGPVQFSTRLRQRNLALHRGLGKVYVFSILLGASFAFAITCVYPIPNSNFKFENLVQASVWFLTTAVAWLAARNGQIALHKTWMARSYGVTFIFVLSRVVSVLPFFRQMGIESATSFLWFLVVIALVLPELFMNGKALLTRQSRP